jgi:hypothetical protein
MTEHPAFGHPAAGRYFIKMHGLRNHFVIVDGRSEAYQPTPDEIIGICDPQSGIGGDQLIVLEKPTAQGLAAGAYPERGRPRSGSLWKRDSLRRLAAA